MQEVLRRFRAEHMGVLAPRGAEQLFHTPILGVPATIVGTWDEDGIGQVLSVSNGLVASAIMMPAIDSEGRLSATLMPAPRIDGLRSKLLGHPMLVGLGGAMDSSPFRPEVPMGHAGDISVAGELMRTVSGKVVRYDRLVLCRTDGDGLLREVLFGKALAR